MTGDGTETAGIEAAATTMSKEEEPALPRASDEVQVTVVVPTGYVAPEAVEHVTEVAPSRASEAEAE
jgi:hypothetical protein